METNSKTKRFNLLMGSLTAGIAVTISLIGFLQPGRAARAAQSGGEACFAEITGDNTTDFSSGDASALRNALAAAAPGSVVKVAGTCAGVANQGGTDQVALITQTLTVQGGYDSADWFTYDPEANPTILDAQGGGRVIKADVAATLTGFTATNGDMSGSGAGLQAASPVTLTSMTFYSNTATSGTGGGASLSGEAVISDTIFLSNTASSHGGGAYFATAAQLESSAFYTNTALGGGGGAYFNTTGNVTGSIFSNNESDSGGGGARFVGEATIIQSMFADNTAMFAQGGGAYFFSPATVISTTFFGNLSGGGNSGGGASFAQAVITATKFIRNESSSSSFGGGGALFRGPSSLFDSAFIENEAMIRNGGGAYFQNASVGQMVNVLFDGNRAANLGSAFYVQNAAQLDILHATIVSPTLVSNQAVYVAGGTVSITNTIVASHTVGIQQAGGTVNEDYTLFDSVTTPYVGVVSSGGNSITGTAAFQDNIDYMLTPASDAVDAGTDAGVTTDYSGDLRPTGSGFDIGYDEFIPSFPLTIAAAGTGSGMVTPTVGVHTYNVGTVVTVTAAADPGSTFAAWSGDCTGTGDCVVTMDAAKSITATFTLDQYSLAVGLDGDGNGSVTGTGIACPSDCDEIFDYGTMITLTATADLGSTFAAWSGDCTGTGDCVVTMDAAKSITATFTLDPYVLTVSLDGDGSGSVTGTGIACPSDCDEIFGYGTMITLTATADLGSTFTGWSGDCTGIGNCVVTMDAAKSVTATFMEILYKLYFPLIFGP